MDAGWEECYDYVFPQDQAAKGSFKLLEAAAKWKAEREERERQAREADGEEDAAVENREEKVPYGWGWGGGTKWSKEGALRGGTRILGSERER